MRSTACATCLPSQGEAMARSVIRTALAVSLATGVAAGASAFAGPPPGHGHGGLKASLVPTATLLPTQCAAGTTGTPRGFAVLNAPGRPGAAPSRVLGTVSLQHAPETNTTFEVDLAVGGTCVPTGTTLSTNGVGNGTAHFGVSLPADNTATSYYVVLKGAPLPQLSRLPVLTERYASSAVALS